MTSHLLPVGARGPLPDLSPEELLAPIDAGRYLVERVVGWGRELRRLRRNPRVRRSTHHRHAAKASAWSGWWVTAVVGRFVVGPLRGELW